MRKAPDERDNIQITSRTNSRKVFLITTNVSAQLSLLHAWTQTLTNATQNARFKKLVLDCCYHANYFRDFWDPTQDRPGYCKTEIRSTAFVGPKVLAFPILFGHSSCNPMTCSIKIRPQQKVKYLLPMDSNSVAEKILLLIQFDTLNEFLAATIEH